MGVGTFIRLLVGAAALIAVGCVVGLALGDQPRFDVRVVQAVVDHRTPWLTFLFQAITWLGSSVVLIPMVAVTMVMTTPPHGRRRTLLAVALVGSIALYDVIKPIVARPRPNVGDLVITATGFSFPSGHATQSAAAYGAIALVVGARYGDRVGRWALCLAVVIVTAVGMSRVYLGVHWPSDVVAGWLLGTAWLWCCATALTGLLGSPNS